MRATIARAWLGGALASACERSATAHHPSSGRAGAALAPRTLGGITLRAHQRDAAIRLRDAIARYGGALLADDVGIGKTYTALAVVHMSAAGRVLVVAPAALRDMWHAALRKTGIDATVVSFERLSRDGTAARHEHFGGGGRFDFVVIDEAHHARNPSTRRYSALARIVDGSPVLLLSATPIHNRRADLDTLFALFLGGRTRALDARDLARLVVRRGRSSLADGRAAAADDVPPAAGRIPFVAPVEWLRPPADDAVPDALLALPPPLPASDAGDGGALVAHALVRQWASSDAALRAAVARRLAAADALADALAGGRHPSRADLRAWVVGRDGVQLAMAELLVADDVRAEVGPLLDTVRRHRDALAALAERLRRSDDADDARAALLAGVVGRHRGEKVVAFASYAETVGALYRRLRHVARAAALTAGGARVAGGRISRREALARFAPEASGAPPPRDCDRVDLLLTTDLLSEGVNLQDASVVVHLDLPWTPARLEQRVGRAARLGARHDRVAVYAMAPPATAECVLRCEARLREKAGIASAAIGATTGPASSLGATTSPRAAPADAERAREVVRGWSNDASARHAASDVSTLVAAVHAPRSGWLALCAPADGEPLVLASLGGAAPADDPATLADAVSLADGCGAATAAAVDGGATARVVTAIGAWAAAHRAAADAGLDTAEAGTAVRRRLLERLAAVARGAPHHRRATVADRCAAARRAALLPLGAAAEQELDAIARSGLPDDEWLDAVLEFASRHERAGAPDGRTSPRGRDSGAVRVLAVLHFVADL